MRLTITVDSIEPDDLRRVLMCHREALLSDESPQSMEADESAAHNGAALVSVSGGGFNLKTIPMSAKQADVFTTAVLGG